MKHKEFSRIFQCLMLPRIPGRRHAHRPQFMRAGPYPELGEDDSGRAPGKMDGVIDVGREDPVDLYEFAVEHARQRRATALTRRMQQ